MHLKTKPRNTLRKVTGLALHYNKKARAAQARFHKVTAVGIHNRLACKCPGSDELEDWTKAIAV